MKIKFIQATYRDWQGVPDGENGVAVIGEPYKNRNGELYQQVFDFRERSFEEAPVAWIQEAGRPLAPGGEDYPKIDRVRKFIEEHTAYVESLSAKNH